MALPPLPRRERVALAVQRIVGWCLSPIWMVAVVIAIAARGWRFADLRASRRAYRQVRREPGPLLVCANHLTLVDSFLVGYVFGSPAWFWLHYRSLPWNVPEGTLFQSTLPRRFVTWLMKCVPIVRGGDRDAIARTLSRIAHLLVRGEVVLIFPEGGRSRKGRVDVEARTWAVGRLLRSVPGCRVLCVHMRGEKQETWSDVPPKGDRFHTSLETFEPKSDQKGLRAALDLTSQVLQNLQRMEESFFETHAVEPVR